MKVFERLKIWAKRIKSDVLAVYFAARDPQTPLILRLFALFIAAYALSPIDLIPDFIPVLGYLDDVLIVPAGVWLIVRYLPPTILSEARIKAAAIMARPSSRWAGGVIVLIWFLCAAYVWHKLG